MKEFYKTSDGKQGELIGVEGEYLKLKQKHGGIIYRKKDEVKKAKIILVVGSPAMYNVKEVLEKLPDDAIVIEAEDIPEGTRITKLSALPEIKSFEELKARDHESHNRGNRVDKNNIFATSPTIHNARSIQHVSKKAVQKQPRTTRIH